jgi:DNA-binding NtrC family response regulator
MASVVLLASEMQLRDGWRAELEARGHDVIPASTAPAAVERLREGGIDVVVVDYDVIGGIDTLLAGLERLPDAPPLVLVSGSIDAPLRSARLGAAAFVPKPCTPSEIVAQVDRLARG